MALVDIPEALIDAFCQAEGTLFLAAGCSMPVPSSLPSGEQLAIQISGEVHARSGQHNTLSEFNEVTFGSPEPKLDDIAEHYLRADGNLTRFLQLVKFETWNRPFNDVHRSVVRLAQEGFLRRAMTTNWDTLIESAADDSAYGLRRIVTIDQIRSLDAPDLILLKLHGCRTVPGSIVAARSQLEGHDPAHLWTDPQLKAMFQGYSVVFVGYSGAVNRISKTMTEVASWWPAGRQHFVVDRCTWDEFRNGQEAKNFVEATSLTESQFVGCDAIDFFVSLVDRLIHYRLRRWAASRLPDEMRDVLQLSGATVLPTLPPVDLDSIDSMASGEQSELYVKLLLRRQSHQAVTPHERQVTRALAWTSILRNRGWSPIEGLPLLTTEDRVVYLVSNEESGSANALALEVQEFADAEGQLQATIADIASGRPVVCVLLLVHGHFNVGKAKDILYDDASGDLAYGSEPKFEIMTEDEFLSRLEEAA